MYSKEQLINIGAEKLADIILSLYKIGPDIQKQMDLIFARFESDPKNIVSIIEEDITSLEESRIVIDYHDSDVLIDHLKQIHNLIMEDLLPKCPNQAVELMVRFLNTYPEATRQVDDSDCEVGDVFYEAYANLVTAYEQTTNSLDDMVDFVYDRYMNHDCDFYSDIILDFKDLLGDNGINLLKQKLEESLTEKNATAIKQGLESIADYQNDVDAYIKACSFTGKLSTYDHLNIVKRLIKHCRGKEAIQWIDSIDLQTNSWFQRDIQDLKIQALVLCGDFKGVQAEKLKWFNKTLSPKIYSEILQSAEADFIDSFKKASIQKALDFPDIYVALDFLKEIKEFEPLAKLIQLKIDALDGNKYYTIRPLAAVLCNVDPLASTLLYRKMIEPVLVRAKAKSYYYQAKDLATCQSLSSKITDWQGHKNHELYVKELSVQHKRKSNFWPEYATALKRMAKETEIVSMKND